MKEMLHRVFAVIVSVCMITSMVPVSAWATSGGGSGTNTGGSSSSTTPDYEAGIGVNTPAPDDEVDEFGNPVTDYDWWMQQEGVGMTYNKNYGYFASNEGVPYGGTKTGTAVRGYVLNPEFQFIEATEPVNYESAAQAHDYTSVSCPATPDGSPLPLQAVLQGGGGNFWITWTLEEGTIGSNGEFIPDPTKTPTDLGTNHMTGTDLETSLSPDGQTLTTFKHEIASGELEDNKFYRYKIYAYNYDPINDTDVVDWHKSDDETILVSTFGCYREMVIDIDNANRPSDKLPNISGYVYWDALAGVISMLSQDIPAETSPIVNTMLQEAAKNVDGAQNITTPKQLTITNIDNRKTDANGNKLPAYLYGLDIQLDIDNSIPELAALVEGDEVTVYRYNPGTDEVEEITGRVIYATDEDNKLILDENGDNVKSVLVTINGSSPNLGVFALGYSSAGSYNLNAIANLGGQITPYGEATYTLESKPKYVIYPHDGYEVDSISIAVRRGSSTQNYSPASDAFTGNILTFDPTRYNVTVGAYVTITVNFKKTDPQDEAYDVTITLQGDGAGEVYYTSGTDLMADTKSDPDNPGATPAPVTRGTVAMGTTEGPISISSEHGLFLEFNWGSGYKLASLTINGEEHAVIGTSYYIPSVDRAMDIVVTYKEGLTEDLTTKTINAEIVDEPTDSSGNTVDTAFIIDDDGTPVKSAVFTVSSGNTKSITVQPEADYSLRYARLYVNGSSDYIDITDQVSQGDNNDILWLFNVVSEFKVEFSYKHVDSLITFVVDQNKGGTIDPVGSYPFESGERKRVVCTPWGTGADGTSYTIGSLTINGTDITDFLESRNDGAYYTFTVMVAEHSSSGDGVWVENGATETDKVLYVTDKSATIVIKYDPVRGPAPAFMTIETEVGGIGGGNITPTQLVQKDSTPTVWFFPDDGYELKRVTVDGIDVTSDVVETNGKSRLDFQPVQTDHKVVVYYTNSPGKTYPKKWTIFPSASSGGFISPDVDTPVYEGESQAFSFFPMTGYYLDKVYVDGDEVDGTNPEIEYNGSSCIIKNVTADHTIHASFVREGSISTTDTAFTVIVKSQGEGKVSPTGTMTIAAGASLPISILPNDGYTYDHVYVKSLTSTLEHGPDHAAEVVKGVFTQYNIHDNYEILVTFRPLNPGEVFEPENINRNLIILTYENANIDEGAVIQPDIDGLTFYKYPGTDYASTPGNFTVILDDDYDLDYVTVDTEFQGTKDVNIIKMGEGVYSFVVDKEFITQNVVINVHTKKKPASSDSVNLRTITVQTEGNGSISPSGIKGVFYVENGKSQSFYFFPDNGWKLDTVYVNNVPVTVSDLQYTIPAVTTNTNVRAVFVQGTQEPSVDDLGGAVDVYADIIPGDDGQAHGNVYPTSTKVIRGGNATFTFEPENGYKVRVYDNNIYGDEITGFTGSSLQLTNIGAGSTIKEKRIAVVFEPIKSDALTYYNITVTHGNNGWVSPAGKTRVAAGDTQTITIIPDTGYTLDQLFINGQDKTSSVSGLSFTTAPATEDITIHATFKTGQPDGSTLNLHELTAYTLAGGMATPTYMQVKSGSAATFSFIAVQDYNLVRVDVDGGDTGGGFSLNPGDSRTGFALSADGVLKLTGVNADHTMVGIFQRDPSSEYETTHHTIFVNHDANGKISPDRAVSVPHGGNQSFTIMPNSGYKIKNIQITDVFEDGSQSPRPTIIESFSGASYTLFNVENDKIFKVEFEPLADGETSNPVNTVNITATASVNGSISPAGTTQVAVGSTAYFNFIPLYGYKLSYAVVDGINVPASMITHNQYVFSNVQEDHTIHAVFCLLTDEVDDFVTVIAGTPNGGSITPSGNVLVRKGSDASFVISNYYGYRLVSIDVDGGTANAANGGFSIGPSSVTTADYSWDGSTFTFRNISVDGRRISATFELTVDNPIDNAGDYTTVTMKGNEPGKGGQTSFPPGTSVIEALKDGEELDISFIPDEKKSIKSIQITYPDGSTQTIVGADADAVWQKGFMTFQPNQVNNGGITIAVEWQDITSEQQKDIDDGKITIPRYHEIVATYEGNGIINPHGRLKIANGASAVFTMVPDSGNELTSLLVDDEEKLSTRTARTYTFARTDTDDHTIHAVYGEVDQSSEYYTVTAQAYGNGKVSPGESIVLAGDSATVHFFPDAGYKLTSLEIDGRRFGYSQPSYTITNISADVSVLAFFNELDPGEVAPTITPIDVIATVQGNGKISPMSAPTADASSPEPAVTVPLGSTQKFSLIPDDGYEVDYIVFNDEILYVSSNVTSYTVTPILRYGAGGVQIANTFEVVFKQKDIVQEDITVNVSVNTDVAQLPAGYVAGSGTVTPSFRVVPYGGSALFYIMPDADSTVYDVSFDGHPLDWVGVAGSTAAGLSGASYTGDAVTSAAVYRGGAATAQAADSNTLYSVYTTTIPTVTHDGTLNVDFRKLTDEDKNKPFVDSHAHKLTVTSEGGGTVSPIGEMFVPEGGTESLRLKTYSGYYLESITVWYYDADGNVVDTIDATDRVAGNFYQFTMGEYDARIHVKYALIGTPSYVHITMGDSKIPLLDANGDLMMDADGNVMYQDVVISNISPELTDVDGNPTDFVRGGTYTFTFQTDQLGPNGRGLVPDKIYYNGQEIPIVPGASHVTFPVNASGKFDIIWRELREDEEPIEPPGYKITTEIASGNGSVSPEPGKTSYIPEGGSITIGFSKGDDGWIVSGVSDWYPDPGNAEPVEHIIPPEQYSEGSYQIDNITSDHHIVVSFVEVIRVYTDWNEDQGYITPNTAPGEFIYVEKNSSLSFIVAPYFGYEVEGVWVDADERTGFLKQSQSVSNRLINQTGNRVIYLEEGEGVQGFNSGAGSGSGSDDAGSGDADSGSGSGDASGASAASALSAEEIDAMVQDYKASELPGNGTDVVKTDEGLLSGLVALATGSPTTMRSMSAADVIASANQGNVGVNAQQKAFARAYEFSTGTLVPASSRGTGVNDICVHATFVTDPNQDIRDSQYKIEGSVIEGIGGTIDPTIAYVDEHGSFTFNFYPEDGWEVKVIRINGNAMEYSSNSYTFTDVTGDMTIEVGFDSISHPGSNSTVNRILRTLQALAQTGDLNGPAVVMLLVIAALSLFFVILGSKRRKKEEEEKQRRRAAYNAYYYSAGM